MHTYLLMLIVSCLNLFSHAGSVTCIARTKHSSRLCQVFTRGFEPIGSLRGSLSATDPSSCYHSSKLCPGRGSSNQIRTSAGPRSSGISNCCFQATHPPQASTWAPSFLVNCLLLITGCCGARIVWLYHLVFNARSGVSFRFTLDVASLTETYLIVDLN